MKVFTKSIQLLCGACVLASVFTSQAQNLFGSPSGNSFAGFTNSTLGSTFTVGNAPISVTALGVFDNGQDGLFRNHDVGIWGSSGLITSVTVPSGLGATLVGDYRYITLGSAVTLSANTTYTIGAFFDIIGGFPFDLTGWQGTSPLDPAFTSANPMLYDGYSVNPSLTQPTLAFPDTLWAANLQYAAVPEPSSLALLGAGLLMVWRVRRKA